MRTEKTCEIISVGTELLLGQIDDTNATWLSEKMATLGLNVYHRQTIGDNRKRLYEAFKLAQSRSDLVIVTGGLGPTDDDLTRDAACDLFGCNLETDLFTMKKIEAYYENRGMNMTENNRKQALSFSGGTVFENEVGMAPGLCYQYDETVWYFLPGVPTEMKWIVDHRLIPDLYSRDFLQYQLYSRELNFQGIGESTIEHELIDLIRKQSNPTIAPLAGDGHVTIRLTAKSVSKEEADELLDSIQEQILSRVSIYYVGDRPNTLERQIIERLRNKNLTFSACESITGGLFASQIVSEPGASDAFQGSIVSYTNEIKENIVNVPIEILERYGAVSEECARSMAEKSRVLMNSDLSISFTGVAGDQSIDGHSSGTVFVAISSKEGSTICEKLTLIGKRNEIRNQATKRGLKIFLNYIKNNYPV
ncbi:MULTISPECIES: competence/damage-inducible protein A [Allobacillus]|uniref:Putative competence-damage inducible protein n=1 Tax=Allobacillus salarius TaxID=1955272 RepID=A0A556PS48_9BACI|nr:competence/damage-inducible protein A [Allobacillus salarius]TSJ67217.1 competence/damage-inducible protein A [Allobacillus salarius]